MDPLLGKTFSHYRLLEKIGAGGMGLVYRARDERLERDVALKVLPAGTLADDAARRRFHKEALALSKLNHPNIATVHDFDTQHGIDFLVMEYVAGMTLGEMLRAGPLEEREVARLAVELAEGLAAAHGQGMIHRDLKPGNVRLTPDGRLKILDFGLAKLVQRSDAGPETMTQTASLTEARPIEGTLPYMAPEQLRGESLDARADLWAAGVVLYEMATGRRPFEAKLDMALAADIQTKAPLSPAQINPKLSPRVEHIILRCLEKDPGHRYQSAKDLLAELKRLAAPTIAPSAQDVRARARARLLRRLAVGMAAAATVLTALLALNVGGLRVWLPRIARGILGSPSPSPIRRQLTFSGNAFLPSLSPDGQFLAYVVSARNEQRILVQDLSGGLPDTVGTLPAVHTLEWSPDGTRLLAGSVQRAVLVPRRPGTVRDVPLPGQFPLVVRAYWLPDGSHVSVHGGLSRQILVVDLETADSVSIPVGGTYRRLQEGAWSPDGRTFAVATTSDTGPGKWAIRAVARDGRTEVVVEDDSLPLSSPRWSRGGDALFYARGSDAIWRVPVSPRTGRRRGAPTVAHQQIDPLHSSDRAFFALTPDGRRMVYTVDLEYSNLWLVEPHGAGLPPLQVQLTRGTAMRWKPVVSPDGRWIAYAEEAGGSTELFRMPLQGGTASQITFGARVSAGNNIAWSPDGSQLAYLSGPGGGGGDGGAQVWVADVEGGRLRPIGRTSGGDLTWAPGARIAYQSESRRNIYLVDPISGSQRALLPDTTSGFVFWPQYSPDGQRMAVRWNRNRPALDLGISVFDLRDASAVKLRAPASVPFGWSADGRYVYAEGDSKVYRLDAQGSHPTTTVLSLPFGEVYCSPAGPLRPNAFVCSAWDLVSDVWMIDNFDAGTP